MHCFFRTVVCRMFRGAALGLLVMGVLACGSSLHASEGRFTAVVKAVQQASPSVVNIHGQKTVAAQASPAAAGQTETVRRVNGMGTGVVIDERGYVLTNHHVVEGVSRIQVSLYDGRDVIAQLVGHDSSTDLAVIKVNVADALPTLNMGTSSDLMTGEPVIAIGNAYGYEHTVTRGIVSAQHRTVQVSDEQKYEDLIQTDAPINPGNSGGPLLNIDGDAIGINVAVRVGASNIAFAIPIDKAMSVAAQLMSTERVSGRYHGVAGETRWKDNSSRFIVKTVRTESPAAKAGLLPGDVVVSVGDKKVARALDWERFLMGRDAGEETPVSLLRNDQPLTVQLALSSTSRKTTSPSERAWEQLGVKLEPMPGEDFKRLNSKYRGGLRVLAVREDGPAAAQGIRTGDVLVGMHVWETVSVDNITYVLTRPDFAEIQPLKFYILRGEETLYGHLRVASPAAANRK